MYLHRKLKIQFASLMMGQRLFPPENNFQWVKNTLLQVSLLAFLDPGQEVNLMRSKNSPSRQEVNLVRSNNMPSRLLGRKNST